MYKMVTRDEEMAQCLKAFNALTEDASLCGDILFVIYQVKLA